MMTSVSLFCISGRSEASLSHMGVYWAWPLWEVSALRPPLPESMWLVKQPLNFCL